MEGGSLNYGQKKREANQDVVTFSSKPPKVIFVG